MRADHAPIRSAAVVGNGIAAWSAAAAIAHRIPRVAVTCVPMAGVPTDLVDLIPGAAPSIRDFHRDIGLDGDDLIHRLDASVRLGTRFSDWSEGDDYIHAFGPHGRAIGGAAFHQYWVRCARHGEVLPFHRFSVAAELGAAGLPPLMQSGVNAEGVAYGLSIKPARYAAYLRAYARHLGVLESTQVIAAEREGDGIARLRMIDGSALEADLYVDATGSAGALGGAQQRAAWTRWLPNNRVIVRDIDTMSPPSPLDNATAVCAGWRLQTSFRGGMVEAVVTTEMADQMQAIAEPNAVHKLEAGRVERAWRSNVVAIGAAAVAVEPMEAIPLHLVHAHVDRLIALWPDRHFADVELAEYNCETAEEADLIRDFLFLHHHLNRRPEPYWRDMAATEPPPLLADTLRLFRERGRLPVRDNDTFSRDSWLSVLIGQGVMPRRCDILAEVIELDAARAMLATIASEVAATVARRSAAIAPRAAELRA